MSGLNVSVVVSVLIGSDLLFSNWLNVCEMRMNVVIVMKLMILRMCWMLGRCLKLWSMVMLVV